MSTAWENCLLVCAARGRAAGLCIVALGIMLGLAAPTPVAATAVSSASASLTLTIIGVTGADLDDLTIDSLIIPDAGVETYGNAWPGGEGIWDEFDFPVWRQEVSAGAYAEPTPEGWAGGYLEISSYIDILTGPDVSPDEPIVLEFRVEWSVSASAVVDNPSAEESAMADAVFVLDPFGEPPSVVRARANTAYAMPGESFSGSKDFTASMLYYSPDIGHILPFSFFLGARAVAYSVAVPVAGTLPLMAAGLVGLGLMGLRRKA